MIVLFDIGNTRTKFCIVKDDVREHSIAISNEKLSGNYLTEAFGGARKVLVASVGHNELADDINQWCQRHNVIYQQVVSEAKKNGIVSAYEDYTKLGIDRWLAIIGASYTFPQKNVLIIDSGTATTFDLLTSDGKHQGGWILAGVDMLITSVLANTTQVHANDNEQECTSFGKNTSENVHNAAWAATVGSVNMAIEESTELGINIDEIIVTGGNRKKLSSLIHNKASVIEDLVFIGLQTYIEA